MAEPGLHVRGVLALAAASASLALASCASDESAGAAASASTRTPPAPRLGRAVTPADAARLDPQVFARDGRGLPPGSGTAAIGKPLYDARCASCHGPGGAGGNSGTLARRKPLAELPGHDRSIGEYWPYAPTVFDYVKRAMPLDAPGSLSDDECYAITAYLLHANGLIGEHEAIDAERLPRVRMPNRDGFVRQPAPPITGP